MATNLVSEILQAFAPSIISRIASGLGLGESSTHKAIEAAVPGLLAALVSLVSKPQGAAKLNDVVTRQEPGVLSSLAGIVGDVGQKAFIDKGSNTLTSLLGNATVSALSNALGKYAGIGESSSKSLLGLLGPAVLGVVGQEQRDRGLDASGLAKLLTSQKESIAAALPSGFSKYIGADILDGVSSASTSKPAHRESGRAYATREPPSVWPWLLGALALFAIGALAWNYLSGRHEQVADTAPQKVEAPYADLLSKLRGVKAGEVDVGELASSAVNDLYASLSGIKDEATAKTAVSGLDKASAEFDQLANLVNQLSPDARKLLADTFTSIRPNIAHLIDRVLAIPGVSAVIKPAIDAINAKLETLVAT
jgi:hypothetical protein